MNTYFISIRNFTYGTITRRPINADTIEKAYTLALSLIGKDEYIISIG